MKNLKSSSVNFILFFVCCALLATAYYLEKSLGIVPCPLCLLQRFAFFALAFVLLLAVIHRPRRAGVKVYSAIVFLFGFLGALLAGRQVYLQSQPLDPNTPCVPGLSYLFKTLPFSQAATLTLKGTTECGQVGWRFLGLSMASWSLLFFVLILLLMALQFFGFFSTNKEN